VEGQQDLTRFLQVSTVELQALLCFANKEFHVGELVLMWHGLRM
jgi:hypothetical protein